MNLHKINIATIFISSMCCAQNLYIENKFSGKVELDSKIYSDPRYSYAGDVELNISIFKYLSLRPKFGGEFIKLETNDASIREYDKPYFAFTACVPESTGRLSDIAS